MSLEDLKTLETISLDFYNNNIKTMNVKQLDMKSRYVKISCTEHGKVITLNPETMSAFVRCKKPDGFSVLNDCTISQDGTLLLELTQQMLAVAGKCTVDIMLFYTNLVDGSEDGNVELSEKGVALNGLTVTDDDAGNVNVSVDENSDFTVQQYTADTIEDIYKLNVPVLSTMTFYLNVLPTAIEHTEIESSYEYDALIQGLQNQELIEKHMKHLDAILDEHEETRQKAEEERQTAESTRNTSEQQRIGNENTRELNESARKTAEEQRKSAETQRATNEAQRQTIETSRTSAENTRISNENARSASEEQRAANESVRQENEASRVAAETARETDTSNAITACNTATANAVQATADAITAANSANAIIKDLNENIIPSATAATDNADKAATVANSAATAANSATDAANAVTTKCQEIIDSRDIANNLTTETEGMVLDASQGRLLYEKIQELQEQLSNMHAVHSGTGEPDDSLGKDGDVYMMIIEDGE